MIFLCLSLAALVGFTPLAFANVVIRTVSPTLVQAGSFVEISGSGFGAEMAGSEVIANYGNDFSYALNVESWSDQSIRVKIPDPGENVIFTLYVKTAKGMNYADELELIPTMVTERSQSFIHQLKVGEKGEKLFNIHNEPAVCGQHGELFVDAEVKVIKRRFADAQIVYADNRLCEQCKPIKVRWFNEPTGFIHYHLNIKKRLIDGMCRNQRR